MRHVFWFGVLTLVLVACSPAAGAFTAAEPTASPAPSRTPEAKASAPGDDITPTPQPTEQEPTSATPEPEERPPAGAESQFETDFTKHSVPYDEILSGGPPKDGIPAIDDPSFVSVEEANEWLEPEEPVILVEVDDAAKAYPVQIMMWHEIVNDTIGDKPVTVTFCPLCNTGIAFERSFEGILLDFGTTGRLRFSNLVMYDRQTETWWQQATGKAIVGTFTGRQLTFVPSSMISWEDFKAAHPDGLVLSRETGYSRDYGRNPYTGYDDVSRSPFLYDGPDTPEALPAMARVVTVELNEEAVAYPYGLLEDVRVVNDVVGGVPIVVLWAPGTASALDASSVAGGDDVGAATTFSRELDERILTFVVEHGQIVDEQTGTEWNLLGGGVNGPLADRALEPVVSVNHFWFSWAAFKPETRIYRQQGPSSAFQESTEESSRVELDADFEINLYQGEDVLGGSSIRFSDVLARDQPVVLNLWAGLCPICRNELPELQDAYETYGPGEQGRDGVLFIGVDVGPFVGLGSKEDGRALLEELGITFPAGSTPDSGVLRDYDVLGTPTTHFILPSGESIVRRTGMMNGEQVQKNVLKLIERAEGS